MKRLQIVGKAILGILTIFSTLSLCWTGAYFATEWGYVRLDWQPDTLLRQLITSILGFFLFGMLMALFGALFLHKKERAFYQEMFDALARISKGDFQVQLTASWGRQHDHFDQLITSINDMALNLREMEDMRQEFISNVSHEIQSPLTSISGFARAMMYEELKRDDQLQYLEIIEAESKRLSKLSDDLLRLASLDSDHHPFHPEVYRLDKQLQLQILAFEPQWLSKELDVHADLAELSVHADPNLLNQVWVNLIHNAIKFTPSDGQIHVTLRQEGEQAVVQIADTGMGLSEEDQMRIFERFFKADLSRTQAMGGSGLGLSIVNKIVEMHQGHIAVSSVLDEGTVFTVTLPLKQ